jgi:hypothetical protein
MPRTMAPLTAFLRPPIDTTEMPDDPKYDYQPHNLGNEVTHSAQSFHAHQCDYLMSLPNHRREGYTKGYTTHAPIGPEACHFHLWP